VHFLKLIANLLVTRIKIIYAIDDGFHSFVYGDCWNLGDFACVEWGKKTVLCYLILFTILCVCYRMANFIRDTDKHKFMLLKSLLFFNIIYYYQCLKFTHSRSDLCVQCMKQNIYYF
jgi:hypothetical protein